MRTYYAVETGQPVSLQCPFRPGNLIQYYEYSWRSGASILAGSRYTVTTDGNFNITATQPSDTNFYQCQVRIQDPITGNPRPLVISGPIELVVYGKNCMCVCVCELVQSQDLFSGHVLLMKSNS